LCEHQLEAVPDWTPIAPPSRQLTSEMTTNMNARRGIASMTGTTAKRRGEAEKPRPNSDARREQPD
jgi:hypothetical protein